MFGKDAETAIAIAKAESGMNCKSISKPNKNGTVDRGLFQLNSAYHPELLDCLENIKKAKQIFDSRGNFKAWVAYNNGKYKKHL